MNPVPSHVLPNAPNDPYRMQAAGAPFATMGSTPRLVYLGLVVLSSLGFFATVGILTAALAMSSHAHGRPDETLMTAGAVVFGLTVLLLYTHIFVGLYWVYKAWEWLPREQRYTKHWRSWISPAQAALLLLVPYFHYYWMFVVSCGLCDALDRMRVTYPTRETAPKGLAIAACVSQLLVPLPVGAILWLVYMSKVERLTREMSHGRLPHPAPAV